MRTRNWPSVKDVRELQCGDEVCFHHAFYKVVNAYPCGRRFVVHVRIVRGDSVAFLDKEIVPLLKSMRTTRKVGK